MIILLEKQGFRKKDFEYLHLEFYTTIREFYELHKLVLRNIPRPPPMTEELKKLKDSYETFRQEYNKYYLSQLYEKIREIYRMFPELESHYPISDVIRELNELELKEVGVSVGL